MDREASAVRGEIDLADSSLEFSFLSPKIRRYGVSPPLGPLIFVIARGTAT